MATPCLYRAWTPLGARCEWACCTIVSLLSLMAACTAGGVFFSLMNNPHDALYYEPAAAPGCTFNGMVYINSTRWETVGRGADNSGRRRVCVGEHHYNVSYTRSTAPVGLFVTTYIHREEMEQPAGLSPPPCASPLCAPPYTSGQSVPCWYPAAGVDTALMRTMYSSCITPECILLTEPSAAYAATLAYAQVEFFFFSLFTLVGLSCFARYAVGYMKEQQAAPDEKAGLTKAGKPAYGSQ